MDFKATQVRTPTSTGDEQVLLEVKKDGQESVEYTVQILDENGGTMGHEQGDMVPYLSASDIAWLRSFMERSRTKFQKLIPE